MEPTEVSAGVNMATHFDEYEALARRLEQIAETLVRKSAKYAARERAGWARAFVTMYHHGEFQRFLDEKSRDDYRRKHENISASWVSNETWELARHIES